MFVGIYTGFELLTEKSFAITCEQNELKIALQAKKF